MTSNALRTTHYALRDVQSQPISPAPTEYPYTISVVMPTFNEAGRIGAIIAAVRAQLPQAEIIVVDDASPDGTADEAAAAGAQVIRRPYNIGNGAGVKTGIRAASGEVVIVMDGDGQHNPADIPRLLAHIGTYDMVVATRTDRTSQENTRRWLGNTAMNTLGTYLAGMPMRDLTSGFRAMRRSVILEFLHLLPNQFGWPNTSAMALAKAGYHIRFEPVTMQKRQGGQSTQRLFKNGIRNILIILRMVSLFAPLRVYFPAAVVLFVLGLLAFLLGFFFGPVPYQLKIPGSAVVLFVGSIIVFMFGLLGEQIAGLWFKGQNRD